MRGYDSTHRATVFRPSGQKCSPWAILPWIVALVVLCPQIGRQAVGSEPRITQSPQLRWLSQQVQRWQKVEGLIDWPKTYANPLDPAEVTVDVLITTPDGRQLVQPAFWMEDYAWRQMGRQQGGEWFYPQGRAGWRVRFTPTQPGQYTAVVRVKDAAGQAESSPVSFTCADGPGHGFLRVSRKDPRFLAFDDGTPFFAIGQNLAFIGSSSQYFTLSDAIEAFHKLATHGANYLRIWTCCEDWALCIEGRKSAWGRSWAWSPPWIERPADIPPPSFAASSDFAGIRGDKLIPITEKPLRPDPSHRVAILPAARYRLSLAVWSSRPGVTLTVRIFGREVDFTIPEGEAGKWTILTADVNSPPDSLWLGPVELSLRTPSAGQPATIYLAGISLRDPTTDRELLWEAEPGRPVLGRYNPVDAFMLDQLVAAAEKEGLYLQLCLLTRDLYMHRLKDPSFPQYAEAIADAKRTFRYAVARWGYSLHVAAWEYWNEMDPHLPTDRFYEELGQYLDEIDPYHHLRTTSTWGPSPKDCRHPHLEIAEVHYYLRPVDRGRIRDEVAAVIDRTAFLREHAPSKPAIIGEFGLADDKWREDPQMAQDTELIHFHNSLWASLMSGLSGTTLFWWWDQLDRMNAYPHYAPVARFAQEIPFGKEELRPVVWEDERSGIRVLGLVGQSKSAFWIIRPNGTWLSHVRGEAPPREEPAEISLPGLTPGKYRVTWWDPWLGQPGGTGTVTISSSQNQVRTPKFTRDIAAVVHTWEESREK